jgi:hypothetical protein
MKYQVCKDNILKTVLFENTVSLDQWPPRKYYFNDETMHQSIDKLIDKMMARISVFPVFLKIREQNPIP